MIVHINIKSLYKILLAMMVTVCRIICNVIRIGFIIKAQLLIGTGKASVINFSLNFINTVDKKLNSLWQITFYLKLK